MDGRRIELRGLLDNLQVAEFLYATQLFPDLQYTFKHSLTHDVTYRGVLHERRRNIHAHVVDAIEKLYADRLGEQVERLAHHAVRAELQEKGSALSPAGGSEGGRARGAVRCPDLVRAGARYSQIRAREPGNDGASLEVRLELRTVLRQLGEVGLMLQHLRQAEVLAEQLNDDGPTLPWCVVS